MCDVTPWNSLSRDLLRDRRTGGRTKQKRERDSDLQIPLVQDLANRFSARCVGAPRGSSSGDLRRLFLRSIATHPRFWTTLDSIPTAFLTAWGVNDLSATQYSQLLSQVSRFTNDCFMLRQSSFSSDGCRFKHKNLDHFFLSNESR